MADALKNESNGPKAVNTDKGAYILQPGQSLPDGYTVSDEDMAAIDAIGFLKPSNITGFEPAMGGAASMEQAGSAIDLGAMGTGGKGPADSLDGKTKAELLEIAEAEDVEGVTEKSTNAEIVDAITAKRTAA